MRIIIVILILSIIPSLLIAQKNAITDTGEEVILYDNGTWKYLKDNNEVIKVIPVNNKRFQLSKNSTFLIKSNRTNTGFYIDPGKWNFKKASEVEDAEYELTLKEGDLYGVIITEKIEVPLEALKKIAFENAKSVASDMQIIKEEYRTVNDNKVLMLEMSGSAEGVKFTYFGYYYSNEKGTTQYVTFTASNLFNEFRSEAEILLNGLVVLK